MNFSKLKEEVRNARKVIEATLASMEAGRARELADVPSDIVELIEASRNREFVERAVALIAEGREHELPNIARQYVLSLRDCVVRERQPGGLLCPPQTSHEVKRCINLLREHLYRSVEQDALEALLRPDEKIVKVTFHEIVTSSDRTITRGQLREYGRGIGFVEDDEIDDAIKAEGRRKEYESLPFSAFSGPNVKPGIGL